MKTIPRAIWRRWRSAWRRWSLWTALIALVVSMLVTMVWLAGRYEASQVQTRLERDAADAVAGDRSQSFACRQAQRDYEVTAGSSSHQPALVEAKRSIMFATCGLREPDRVEAPVVPTAPR